MTIQQFIDQHNLEKTLLMGYYGGGNYGDELLLEVMMNLLAKKGVKSADVTQMPYCNFAMYHRNFGYAPFKANSILQLLRAIVRNKNIIVGGGGIWGLDAKLQPFLMSVALFMARFIFGKNVYLLGVGYYQSTNWYGHFGAWLAAKASSVIIARDKEAAENFKKFQPNTHQDTDISWYLKRIDLRPYIEDAKELDQELKIDGPTLLITLRRFNAKHSNNYNNIINQIVKQYSDRKIVVAILEPGHMDQANYDIIKSWEQKFDHVQAIDFKYNPIALFLFLQKHHKNLAVISPQFHAIISAYLQNVPFMPLVYDNKVSQLFDQIGVKNSISIYKLKTSDVSSFIQNLDEARP